MQHSNSYKELISCYTSFSLGNGGILSGFGEAQRIADILST